MEKIEEIKGRKVSIDVLKINLLGFVSVFAVTFVFALSFFMIWNGKLNLMDKIYTFYNTHSLTEIGISIIIVSIMPLVGMVIYMLIQGITWACYAKNGWKSISFGAKKLLVLYCRSNEPMSVRAYQIGCIMPVMILAVIPTIVSLFVGSILLLVWGIIFISSACQDIWMAWKLNKEDKNALAIDIISDDEAGVYILDEEN